MRTLVLVLTAAAAGFLGGYLARAPAETAPRAERTPANRAPARPGRTGAGPQSELGRALDALPPPEPRRGEGRIDGTVRWENGDPIPGVRVRARLFPEFDMNRMRKDPDEEPLESRVRALVDRVLVRNANTFETVTDAEGWFAFEGLAEAEYDVSATLDDLEVVAEGDSFATPDARVDFVAHTIREVTVAVSWADGSTPDSAGVQTTDADGDLVDWTQWTPASRLVELPPGAYEFTATLDEARSEPVSVVVPASGPVPAVTLQLKPKEGLFGKVTFAEGDPLGTVTIYALRLGAGEKPDSFRLVEEGERTWLHPRRLDGSRRDRKYEFDGDEVPGKGRFMVGVALNNTVLAWRVVDTRKGPGACDFHVETLPRENFLAIDVRGPDGKPVTDVAVLAGVDVAGSVSTDDDSGFRLRDGGLLVAHHPAETDARRFVEVVSKRFGRARVYYEPGAAGPLRVDLAEPARLRVTLRGYAGSGDEGFLRAALVPPDRSADEIEEIGGHAAAFGDDGLIELGPVGSGAYLLVVYVLAGDKAYEAARHDVELRKGENRLEVPLPELHRLVVAAPGLEPGDILRLEPEEAVNWLIIERRVGPDRRVTFERLPAGPYSLGTDDDAWMRVEVPQAGVFRFEPGKPVYNALRVYVSDPHGVLAQAGFQDEDLVIGMGGNEFESQSQMQTLAVQAAARPGTTKLMVVRAGRRIELEVDLQSILAAGENAGGGFRRTSR